MRSEQRGSALITVILVVLVLTMIGLAASLYMTMEDRVSQNDKLSQAAFHAAQAGLKAGEQVFNVVSQNQLQTILDPNTFKNSANDEPQSLGDLTTAAHLGTVLYSSGALSGGTPLLNQSVGGSTLVGNQEQYSVFVRNDPNDYLASDGNFYTDHNATVAIVSRGVVLGANGQVAAVKVLSEEIDFGSTSTPLKQFRGDQTGTSSTPYQGN
ncbi:MAG: PilX N-terminal domain-containing pilus assembly protein [Acidobacteriota bacterium]